MWKDGYWFDQDDAPKVSDLFGRYEDDKPACWCCHSEVAPLKVYRMDPIGIDKRDWDEAQQENRPPFKALCEICANTLLGTNANYPEQHDGDALATQKLIAYVGNMILAELRGKS